MGGSPRCFEGLRSAEGGWHGDLVRQDAVGALRFCAGRIEMVYVVWSGSPFAGSGIKNLFAALKAYAGTADML